MFCQIPRDRTAAISSPEACDYYMRLPGPGSRVLQVSFPEQLTEARHSFGSLASRQVKGQGMFGGSAFTAHCSNHGNE